MLLVRLLGVSVLGAGCAHASHQEGADGACGDFQTDIEHVWSEKTKVAVRASLMDRWGGEIGVDVAQKQVESVTSTMDRVAQDWVMLRRATCMDHFKRGVGTADAYQARARCFDDVLQTQRNVLIALQKATHRPSPTSACSMEYSIDADDRVRCRGIAWKRGLARARASRGLRRAEPAGQCGTTRQV